MATITKTEHGTYRVRWRDPQGRGQSKTFKRRTDANDFRVDLEGRLRGGSYIAPRLSKVLFGEWAEHVMRSRLGLHSSTRSRDKTVMARMVLPYFAEDRLGSVNPMQVQRWVTHLDSSGYAANSTRKAYQLLAAVFDAAASADLIPRSPCRKISLPRVESKEMRFLDPGEVVELAAVIDPRYRTLATLAAATGLRWGEAVGLTIDRLQLLKRSVTVSQTLSEVRGQVKLQKSTKTASSGRTVSLPAFLVDDLAAHLTEYPSDNGFVFTGSEGSLLRRTNFRRRVWLPAVQASVGEPMRFHDLRHTHAAQLIAAGEHPKVIQERLGHASIRTTLDTYGHLFAGLDEQAAERIDTLYREARASDSRQIRAGKVIAIHP